MATARIAGMTEEFTRNLSGNKVIIRNNGRIVGEKNRLSIVSMLNLARAQRNQERIKYYETMLSVLDGKIN